MFPKTIFLKKTYHTEVYLQKEKRMNPEYEDPVRKSPSFIINLKRFRDRFDYAEENLKNAGYTDIRLADGVDALEKELDLFGIPSIKDMTPDEIGCLLSHMKIYQTIIDEEIPYATIFEDDVYFHPDYKRLSTVYKNPMDFDIVFIGHPLEHCLDINNSLEMIKPIYCTRAYILTLKGAKTLLNQILFENRIPMDLMIFKLQTNSYNLRTYSWNEPKCPCPKEVFHSNLNRETYLVLKNTVFVPHLEETLLRHKEIYEKFRDHSPRELNIQRIMYKTPILKRTLPSHRPRPKMKFQMFKPISI
jgi:glycosyl transferase family 25